MMKILIVDDDPNGLYMLEAILKGSGYEVASAANGAEALEKLNAEDFEVIISDILMPVMDGFQLCRKVKGSKDLNHIIFIFYTSTYTEEKDEELALKMGADKFIQKPVEPDEFIKIVEGVICDIGKGKAKPRKADLGEEKEVFKLYSESLVKKLEKKMLALEKEINQRKLAEEALQFERNKLVNILDSIEDGLYIVNQQYDIEYVNPVLKEKFGAVEERKCYMYFHDRKEACPWCKNKDILAGKTVRWEWYSFKNQKTYDLIDTPLINPDGSISKLEIFRDITERKSIEEQLRQSQKMEAIGTLAGGVAHDFNNLLTVIIGNAELALMDVIKNESLRTGIEETKKAGEKAASLTRQLLAFSRKQVIKPEVIDLNEGINETKNMLKRTIGEDIEFLTILEPELRKVYADSGQIDQVIMNMVVNARDAMPQGGKLTIETANVDLDKNYFREHGIKGEKPGHYVMLAVCDTGSGMDKEIREHIFEPFFTTKEVGKGTGLGLSTVYGIAKQNNGFVWVYSEPGQGSIFKVYLPKVKGDAEPEEKEQTPVDDLSGSETVLIVEDDYGLRKFTQKVLQSYGYRTLVAENGEDAPRVCKEHEGSIHLLLTDVVMPKMGGKKLAERLRSLYPQMKVIYMSGYTDNAIVRHGVLEPGLNFLEKPFTLEGLARKVREALENEN